MCAWQKEEWIMHNAERDRDWEIQNRHTHVFIIDWKASFFGSVKKVKKIVKYEKLQKALTTLILKRIIITNWSVHFRRTDWCIVSFQGNIGSFRLPTLSRVAIAKHRLILYCRFRLIDMFFQYVATRHSFSVLFPSFFIFFQIYFGFFCFQRDEVKFFVQIKDFMGVVVIRRRSRMKMNCMDTC